MPGSRKLRGPPSCTPSACAGPAWPQGCTTPPTISPAPDPHFLSKSEPLHHRPPSSPIPSVSLSVSFLNSFKNNTINMNAYTSYFKKIKWLRDTKSEAQSFTSCPWCIFYKPSRSIWGGAAGIGKNHGLWGKRAWIQIQTVPLADVWPWTNDLASQRCHFLIYEKEEVMPPFSDGCEDSMSSPKWRESVNISSYCHHGHYDESGSWEAGVNSPATPPGSLSPPPLSLCKPRCLLFLGICVLPLASNRILNRTISCHCKSQICP